VVTDDRSPVIRRASDRDARQLAALAAATFRDTYQATNTRENIDLHCATRFGEAIQAAEIADPGRVTLVCDHRGTLAGFAQLRWVAAPGCVVAATPGEIQRLYVARGFQGTGVGRALMDACLDEMVARRTDVVWLCAWERNPGAIAFYRKLGFVEAGEHVFLLGRDLQRDVVMTRRVQGGSPAC
jgi:diamine N-acetyltransferase